MKDLIGSKVSSFIRQWRIANTRTLRTNAFNSSVSYEGLKSALARLRHSKSLLSCRIGPEVYHFDPIFRRRWQALRQLPVHMRWNRAQRWGFEHHLKVIELGFTLETLFPEVHVSANIFSDFVSFAEGTTNNQGKKFCPDLSVSFKFGELSRFIFVEFERTSKTKKKYLERWLAYHNDPTLSMCLYIVTDPNLEKRLQKQIEDHLKSTHQRDRLKFGLLCLTKDLTVETKIKVFTKGRKNVENLLDIFKTEQPPSRTRLNFLTSEFSNDLNGMNDRVRLTTLPLPSSSSKILEVPDGTERVVNLTRLESNKY